MVPTFSGLTKFPDFCSIFTGRNEVVAKVMFLLVSVILLAGGGMSEADPPGSDTPPGQTDTPKSDPPRSDIPLGQTSP